MHKQIQKRIGKKRIGFSIDLNEPLMRWLRHQSDMDGVSMSFVVANALAYISGIESGNEISRKRRKVA